MTEVRGQMTEGRGQAEPGIGLEADENSWQ